MATTCTGRGAWVDGPAAPRHLGLKDGVPRVLPTPLPPQGLSDEAADLKSCRWPSGAARRPPRLLLQLVWPLRKRCAVPLRRVSDSLPLDRCETRPSLRGVESLRPQRDFRSKACRLRAEAYPSELPTASVVMVFHNEALSVLLRPSRPWAPFLGQVGALGVQHGVPKATEGGGLQLEKVDATEVILVDDASHPDDLRFYRRHWPRPQAPLSTSHRLLRGLSRDGHPLGLKVKGPHGRRAPLHIVT